MRPLRVGLACGSTPATISLRTLRSHRVVAVVKGIPSDVASAMERTRRTVAADVIVSITKCSSRPSCDTHCAHDEHLEMLTTILQKPREHTMTPSLVEAS